MEWFVFALGTAVFASLATVIEKKTLIKEHPMEFSAVLALFNLLISLPLLFFVNFNIPSSILGILYIGSLFGTVAFLYVARALRHMEISLASPLLSFSPAIVLVLSFFILGERISFLQLIGILVLIFSAYILETPKHLNLKEPIRIFIKSKYIHFIFIALILYAFSSIIDKFVISYMTPLSYILIVHFFISVNFFALMFLFHNGLEGIKHGIKNAGKMIFVVSLFTFTYRLLQIQAISMTFVSLVIPIKRLSTLFSTIIGGEMFHEKRLLLRSIISIVMLFGTYLIITG